MSFGAVVMSARDLRLILGDQLNASHSWYRVMDSQVVYLIAELHQETGYVRHHVQKVCAFFAAMQAFAQALASAGHRVLHLTLDDAAAYEDLPALIAATLHDLGASQFQYQQPDEYRLAQQLGALRVDGVAISCVESEHFFIPHHQLTRYAKPGERKQMEAFYRRLRKQHQILMDGEQPLGERWNFDQDNRNKLTREAVASVPAPLLFQNPVGPILARLARHRVDTMGVAMDALPWPVNRAQALALLRYFCEFLLPHFGRYQDAMTGESDQGWSLYHSRLSFAINAKMISPRRVIDCAIAAWRANPENIDLAQLEGFVRQILGWREFVRVIYWANMPHYRQMNALQATRPLPEWFWNGNSQMRCLQLAIGHSLTRAYAHHIQRLMIIGNFALLAGLHPDPLDEWYLGIYVDAIEWVELPNTRGMSQFADGGIVGSKPYAAGGAYVDKKSDYCRQCRYQVREKLGPDACPMNSLYWHFLDRYRGTLGTNRRLALAYANWDKHSEAERKAIRSKADWVLENIEQL